MKCSPAYLLLCLHLCEMFSQLLHCLHNMKCFFSSVTLSDLKCSPAYLLQCPCSNEMLLLLCLHNMKCFFSYVTLSHEMFSCLSVTMSMFVWNVLFTVTLSAQHEMFFLICYTLTWNVLLLVCYNVHVRVKCSLHCYSVCTTWNVSSHTRGDQKVGGK